MQGRVCERELLRVQVVRDRGCQTVVDYGCGEGSWIKSLLLDPAGSSVVAVAGVDESPTALQRGCKRVLAAMVKHHAEEELRGHSVPAIQLLRVRFACVQPLQLPSVIPRETTACRASGILAFSPERAGLTAGAVNGGIHALRQPAQGPALRAAAA